MRVRAAVVALVLAGTLVLGGCGALHGGVTAEANECALALPVAEQVVGHHGRLVLIRPMGRREAERLAEALAAFAGTTVPAGSGSGSLCVVVFRGPYLAGMVQGAPLSGLYTIVVADVRHQRVVAVYVTDGLPRSMCLRHEVCTG